MDFIDQIRDLAERALDLKDDLETEEATKNALIMPFIRLLGYDVFNPREVVPEFTADVGIKKGEKVDYAIMRDGDPTILFECKASKADLDSEHASQLYRYFSVVDARFGVLTNGILYRFYTDLESSNRMDKKPFLELNLLDIKESLVEELKKFAKDNFDVDNILSTASELKYAREIKRILSVQYDSPSPDFVRFCINEIYTGAKTQNVIDQFTGITKRALHQFVNDRINDRLKSALTDEAVQEAPQVTPESPSPPTEPDLASVDDAEETTVIETTEDELRAFYVIKSILHGVVDLERIAIRDRISYCGILLDDNNRKPICRLHFNSTQKYIGVFDSDRNEERIPVSGVDDIFQHSDKIRGAIAIYEEAGQ